MSETNDLERVRLLREMLTATSAGIYLATHVAGPLPAESLAAVREWDELELRLGRVGPDRPTDLALREQEARAALAAVVGAPFDEVALAHGAADGARTIALACLARRGAGPGRVVIVDGVAYPVRAAVAGVAAATGLAVEVVPMPPRILAADTVLVLLAHVDGVGDVSELLPVASAARRVGAHVVLDASLAVGALPMRVAETAVDAIVADVHHWLLGPDAVAMVWVSPTLGEAVPAKLAAAAGPFGRGQLLAAARGAGWLLMYVGMPWLIERTTAMAGRLRSGLASIDAVELEGDPAHASALLAFRIPGWRADEAADELSHRVHAISDPEPDGSILRVSVGAWNTEALDRFVAGVAELAAHGPETLPRRPTLTVIGGPLADADA